MHWVSNDRCLQCGTEGHENDRLYACEPQRKRRLELPRDFSKHKQQTVTSHKRVGLGTRSCGKKITGYELEHSKHVQEQWTTQGTHDTRENQSMVNTACCQQSVNVRNIETHVNFTLCERRWCRQILQFRILTYTVVG